MPVISAQIDEVTTHILDPICEQIVYTLVREAGVEEYFENNIEIKPDYRTTSFGLDSQHRAAVFVDQLDVAVDPSFNPMETRWQSTSFRDLFGNGISLHDLSSESPVFLDSEAGIAVYEKRVPCSVSMEFLFTIQDRNTAYRLVDTLNTMYPGTMRVDTHTVVYDYPITPGVFVSLHRLYQMRKSLHSKMTFQEFLEAGSMGKSSITLSLNTKIKEPVIRCSDVDVMGTLDFGQAKPEAIKVNDASTHYTITGTYGFQFMRPNMNFIRFPVIIENELVPGSLIDPGNSTLGAMPAQIRDNAIAAYTKNNTVPYRACLRVPFYDDWEIPSNHPFADRRKHLPVAQCAFLLDDGPMTEIDLVKAFAEDFEAPLNDTLITILKEQGESDTKPMGTGLFQIGVFANDHAALDPMMYRITPDLKLQIMTSNTLRRYHFVLTETVDFDQLGMNARKILLKHRSYFPSILIKQSYKLQQANIIKTVQDRVLTVTGTLLHNGMVKDLMAGWVEQKKVSTDIYDYTCFAEQLIWRIIELGLYSDYCNLLLGMGKIKEYDFSTVDYLYPSGKILVRDGGMTYGYNQPARLLAANIYTG